jgi:phosphinothricin acetyltransferase
LKIGAALIKMRAIRMSDVSVRVATRFDLPRLTEIYNYYVVNTPVSFDLEPVTVEARAAWFDEHSDRGPHRLLVAEARGVVVGYASTGRFRAKPAYNTTVESSIYCAPEEKGRGIGGKLYAALFDAIAGEDINRIVAGVVIPNDASIALHRRLGFREIGTFTENGRKFGRFWDVVWFERPLRL